MATKVQKATHDLLADAEAVVAQRESESRDARIAEAALLERLEIGDDSVTEDDMRQAELATQRADALERGARRALDEARAVHARAVAAADPVVAEIAADVLSAAFRAEFPHGGGPTVETGLTEPASPPVDLPSIVVVQKTPTVRNVEAGTVGGEAIAYLYTTESSPVDWPRVRSAVQPADRWHGLASRVEVAPLEHAGQRPTPIGEGVVRWTIGVKVQGGRDALPVLTRRVDPFRLSAFAQGISGTIRDRAGDIREVGVHVGGFSNQVRSNVRATAQITGHEQEERDGILRRTLSVDLTVRSNAFTFEGIAHRTEAVLKSEVGRLATGLGRVESVEVLGSQPASRNALDFRVRVDLVARAA